MTDRNYMMESDRRIDIMLEAGLLDEVKLLVSEGYSRELVSMQGLGYKEIIDYIQGRCTLDEAVYTLKRDTRHFAKETDHSLVQEGKTCDLG